MTQFSEKPKSPEHKIAPYFKGGEPGVIEKLARTIHEGRVHKDISAEDMAEYAQISLEQLLAFENEKKPIYPGAVIACLRGVGCCFSAALPELSREALLKMPTEEVKYWKTNLRNGLGKIQRFNIPVMSLGVNMAVLHEVCPPRPPRVLTPEEVEENKKFEESRKAYAAKFGHSKA